MRLKLVFDIVSSQAVTFCTLDCALTACCPHVFMFVYKLSQSLRMSPRSSQDLEDICIYCE